LPRGKGITTATRTRDCRSSNEREGRTILTIALHFNEKATPMALALGLNSGSSFDGVDAVLVAIENASDGYPGRPKFVDGIAHQWPPAVAEMVLRSFENKISIFELCRLVRRTLLVAMEQDGDLYAVMVPTAEIVRFYYGPSTRLAQALFWGGIRWHVQR